MRYARTLINEILIAIVIGSLPLILTVKLSGNLGLAESFSSIKPSDPVFIYLLALLIFHLILTAVNYVTPKHNEKTTYIIKVIHDFSYQVGYTIHGVYRAIAGAVPAAIWLMSIQQEVNQQFIATGVLSLILVAGSLAACCILNVLTKKTAPKQKWLNDSTNTFI